MALKDIFKQHFQGISLDDSALGQGEYESCVFEGCNFSNACFAGYSFIDCEFVRCDLSMSQLAKATLRSIQFKECKLLGVHFEDGKKNISGLSFFHSNLSLTSFYQMSMKQAIFKDCMLKEADFTETILTQALFERCNLEAAIFDRTQLDKADLRSSFGYAISPTKNRIKKAKFSLPSVLALLDEWDIVVE